MNVLLAVGIALAGVLLGALIAGWFGYQWGRSDGKLAERTRRTAFELERNRRQREHQARKPATPWVTEPPRPSPLDRIHAAQVVPAASLATSTTSSGWLIPAHSDWTGPQARIDPFAAYQFDADGKLIEVIEPQPEGIL